MDHGWSYDLADNAAAFSIQELDLITYIEFHDFFFCKDKRKDLAM
jgi:hypothetical protein